MPTRGPLTHSGWASGNFPPQRAPPPRSLACQPEEGRSGRPPTASPPPPPHTPRSPLPRRGSQIPPPYPTPILPHPWKEPRTRVEFGRVDAAKSGRIFARPLPSTHPHPVAAGAVGGGGDGDGGGGGGNSRLVFLPSLLSSLRPFPTLLTSRGQDPPIITHSRAPTPSSHLGPSAPPLLPTS